MCPGAGACLEVCVFRQGGVYVYICLFMYYTRVCRCGEVCARSTRSSCVRFLLRHRFPKPALVYGGFISPSHSRSTPLPISLTPALQPGCALFPAAKALPSSCFLGFWGENASFCIFSYARSALSSVTPLLTPR